MLRTVPPGEEAHETPYTEGDLLNQGGEGVKVRTTFDGEPSQNGGSQEKQQGEQQSNPDLS